MSWPQMDGFTTDPQHTVLGSSEHSAGQQPQQQYSHAFDQPILSPSAFTNTFGLSTVPFPQSAPQFALGQQGSPTFATPSFYEPSSSRSVQHNYVPHSPAQTQPSPQIAPEHREIVVATAGNKGIAIVPQSSEWTSTRPKRATSPRSRNAVRNLTRGFPTSMSNIALSTPPANRPSHLHSPSGEYGMSSPTPAHPSMMSPSGPAAPGGSSAVGHVGLDSAVSGRDSSMGGAYTHSTGAASSFRPLRPAGLLQRPVGPVYVHQYNTFTGDAGTPCEVIVNVDVAWARNVGLLVGGSRIGDGTTSIGTSTPAQTRLLLVFGSCVVETQATRLNTSEAISSPASARSEDLEIHLSGSAPSFYDTRWSTSRVTLHVRAHIDITDQASPLSAADALCVSGIDVADFIYPPSSPRDTWRRDAEHRDEPTGLRRPASFPALVGSFDHQVPSSIGKAPSQRSISHRNLSRMGEVGLARTGAAPFAPQHRPTLSSSSAGQLSDASTFENGGVMGKHLPYCPPNWSNNPLRRNSIPIGGGVSELAADAAHHTTSDPPSVSSATEHLPSLIRTPTHASPRTKLPSLSLRGTSTSSAAQASSPSRGPDSSSSSGSPRGGPSQLRANLEIQSDLNGLAIGWSHAEWQTGRRLIQFWRRQEGTTIMTYCKAIHPHEYKSSSIVVSCIFRADNNKCYITSVDTIYLLEALVGTKFTVEEKNRIRRNLEGFRPQTISKSTRNKEESIAFFQLIMSFPNPKPRNIEKDVKVFAWDQLANMLKKIISKYSACSSPVLEGGVMSAPQMHARNVSISSTGSIKSNPTPPSTKMEMGSTDSGLSMMPPTGQHHYQSPGVAGLGDYQSLWTGTAPSPSHPHSQSHGLFHGAPRGGYTNDYITSPMNYNNQPLHGGFGAHVGSGGPHSEFVASNGPSLMGFHQQQHDPHSVQIPPISSFSPNMNVGSLGMSFGQSHAAHHSHQH
ncbi:hypothetical protein CBOM_06152 [Ceraceosorus bombacis]|uniref:DUF7082 domain-containing protein n=2 Tax=Ceraceosorus TaxID=401624 RepID=A0A0P1BKF6_9BASI|nr:hypothetical protein CBOM_06152 [Ceraceosorus bombacis]